VDEDKKWSRAGFRIGSESLTAAEIGARLGLSATWTRERGERINPENPQSRIRKEALWGLKSGLSTDEPLDRHLGALLERLEPRSDELAGLARECWMDFFAGFASLGGQGGFTLDRELLARLARIPGNGLDLDLYPPPSDVDADAEYG
jgi:hypothetical protein